VTESGSPAVPGANAAEIATVIGMREGGTPSEKGDVIFSVPVRCCPETGAIFRAVAPGIVSARVSTGPESVTVFPQPPLVRAFFLDRLPPLVGGQFTIVEVMNESEGVSGDQRTNPVAKVAADSLFGRGLRRMNIRKGCLTPWSSSDRHPIHAFRVLRGGGMKPSAFRDPELAKTLLPCYRRRAKEVKPLITPHRVITVDHKRAERREREPIYFPTRSQHGWGVPRVKVSGVAEV